MKDSTFRQMARKARRATDVEELAPIVAEVCDRLGSQTGEPMPAKPAKRTGARKRYSELLADRRIRRL